MMFQYVIVIASVTSDLRKVNTATGVSLVTTFIVPLFALTINVVLFSSLMLPLIKRLSEIIDLVKEIETPVDNIPIALNDRDDNSKHYWQKINEARASIEKFYIEYASKYGQLRRYKRIFYGMLIAAISVLSYAFWPNIKSVSWVVMSYLVLFVLIFSLWLSTIRPTRFASIAWLIREARMNPFSMKGILGPALMTSPSNEEAAKFDAQLCHFYVTPRMFLVGWRFYVDVVDPDDPDKVYFVAFGPCGYGKFNQRILDGMSAKYQTLIGTLSLKDIKIPAKKTLQIRFYCFLPMYKRSTPLPMYGQGVINLESEDGNFLHTSETFRAGTVLNLSASQKIVPIEYSMRWGSFLTKLNLDADSGNGKNWYGTYELFKKIQYAVRFTPSIQSYSDNNGELLAKLPRNASLPIKSLLPLHHRFLTKDLSKTE